MSTDFNQLLEMGFAQIRVEKALRFTSNSGLQPALDWLWAHQDDPDIDEPTVAATTSVDESKANDGDQHSMAAKSLKCDDCGKLFSNDQLVQLHSTRTGHVNFSESVEEIKPLSEEEKREQMQILQEKMKLKREEREKQEAEENLQRERHRRLQGKNIIDSKTKFEEDEIKRLAEQKRREKEEDKIYRQKLKDEIARDRESRKKVSEPPKAEIAAKPLELKPSVGNFDSCRIQIRNQKGQPIVETFAADDCLSKVMEIYAQRTAILQPYNIQFRTTMPPKLYGPESMAKTLRELGFCPSIVLMVVVDALN